MASKYNKDYFETKFSTTDPWDYTTSNYEFKKYQRQIDVSNKYVQNPLSILEIGCAEGVFTEMIRKEYPNSKITSIDISEAAIERASQRGLHNTEFIRTDISEFIENHQNGRFDIVYVSEIIYYLGASYSVRDLLTLIRKLSLLMNKGGIIIMANNIFLTKDIPAYIVEKPLVKTYEFLFGTVFKTLKIKPYVHRDGDKITRYRLSVFKKINSINYGNN